MLETVQDSGRVV